MKIAIADKLLDLANRHAGQIAGQWYNSLSTNARTPSFHKVPRETNTGYAISFYESLGEIYHAVDCYQAVANWFNKSKIIEDYYKRGIPLEEVVYALILLRRRLWLYADSHALYFTANEAYQALHSVNHTILLFDYALYITVQKYQEASKEQTSSHTKK